MLDIGVSIRGSLFCQFALKSALFPNSIVPIRLQRHVVVPRGDPIRQLVIVVPAAGVARFAAGIDRPQPGLRVGQIGDQAGSRRRSEPNSAAPARCCRR